MGIFKCLFVISVALVNSQTMGAHINFAQSSAQFSYDLYKTVIDSSEGKNVIISPLSIQTAVALAFMGAEGVTAQEMATGLRLGTNERSSVGDKFRQLMESYAGSPMLRIANKIYTMTGHSVKPEFNEIATKSFHSEAQSVNFADSKNAASTINQWVEEKTNNKIKDLISADSLDSLTRMVLVNAIYFKGFWEHKFNAALTRQDDFWISETESQKVDMMTVTDDFKFGYFRDLDATAVELPYKNSDLSMLIILPNERTGLKNLEQKLGEVNLFDLTSKMHSNEVIVKLPKFKIEFEIKLNDVLQKMGMETMFTDDADFSSLLTGDEKLKVSEVVHKAFIEVNEEGAEAAAATGVEIQIERGPLHFLINKPFLYTIKDNAGQIFFMGRYLKI